MDLNGNLFDLGGNSNSTSSAPLAHRMRPMTLSEFMGQDKVLGQGKPLRQWIEADRVPSLIFWGPPGCGKTTLAQIIAKQTLSQFENLSAVLAGVKDIKEVVARAHERKKMTGRKTILFVDEIHRFNKSQQDALLPHVENGTVTLIGATTENPSFELNTALLSRCRVIRFEPLSIEAIALTIKNALGDPNRGFGGFLKLEDEAIQWLAHQAEGDARRALTALEAVALYNSGDASKSDSDNNSGLTAKDVQAALESAMTRQPIPYDKSGEEHYNVISAFIKSIRDSDPHAAVYYLARMIEGGEDPLFIARRLVILASEDIGNADPRAIMVAIAVKDAVEFIGMPEARISLSQAVTYLAVAPKSNASYEAINQAQEEVNQTGALPVPMHLRNAVTGLMKAQGYSQGYRYPHSEKQMRTGVNHLPEAIHNRRFYNPKDSGLEIQIKERLKNWGKAP
ncbi:MAG: replication-associated recombination protein A [Bdellovibrionia bacterium]